jgi:hypothetical protein
VAILFTTTAIDLGEDLLNRGLVLTVDGRREPSVAVIPSPSSTTTI